MGIVIFAVLFNDLPWEKALRNDPDFRQFEDNGRIALSTTCFAELSAAMWTLLSEVLSSDAQRRCPVSELVQFFAEPRAWFASDEVGGLRS
jgi:hypothetical protein